MCNQQRLRPACAYAQTDQSLCWSLEYSRRVKLLTEHHLECLSLKGGFTGSSESTLVKMPHCWKSCVTAQMAIHFTKQLLQRTVSKWTFQPGHSKRSWHVRPLKTQTRLRIFVVWPESCTYALWVATGKTYLQTENKD